MALEEYGTGLHISVQDFFLLLWQGHRNAMSHMRIYIYIYMRSHPVSNCRHIPMMNTPCKVVKYKLLSLLLRMNIIDIYIYMKIIYIYTHKCISIWLLK